ncbi:MAG: ATP-binding cassette domain-containing protein [Roseiarcus sp.]
MIGAALAPTLRVAGINKSFGLSKALFDVSFDVGRGRVHALVGENGAGKSTLVKIVTGIIETDSGDLFLGGRAVRFNTPIEARRAGVGAVYQDPKLFPHLDVAENIAMGNAPVTAVGVVDRKAMYARASKALAQLGVDVDPHALIAGLSVAELQFVEIARAHRRPSASYSGRTDLGAHSGRSGEALSDRARPSRRGQVGPPDHAPPGGVGPYRRRYHRAS